MLKTKILGLQSHWIFGWILVEPTNKNIPSGSAILLVKGVKGKMKMIWSRLRTSK